MAQVLHRHEAGLDFADAFHVYTFDEKFIKRARGLTNCEVAKP